MSGNIGSIYVGGGHVKVMLLDSSGAAKHSFGRPLTLERQQPGWSQIDVDVVWTALSECVGALKDYIGTINCAAVGICAERDTAVCWSRDSGEPLHACLWSDDVRAAELAASLSAKGGADRFRAKTGLMVSPRLSGVKLAWMLANVEAVRAAAEAGDLMVGTLECWLVWKLTGGASHVIDASSASTTLLMDLGKVQWDAGLAAAVGLPRGVLMPAIVPSAGAVGRCAPRGPLSGVPVCALLGDQQAAMFGLAAFERGDAVATFGADAAFMVNTGSKAVRAQGQLEATVAYQLEGSKPVYAVEAPLPELGSALPWLCNENELRERALRSPSSSGVAFSTTASGGCLSGLAADTTVDQVCRAALESVAYSSAAALGAVQRATGLAVTTLRVDNGISGHGGLTSVEEVMQLHADLLQVPVERSMRAAAACYGAAFAAGIGSGAWTLEQVQGLHRSDTVWEARMSAQDRDAKLAAAGGCSSSGSSSGGSNLLALVAVAAVAGAAGFFMGRRRQ